MTGSTGRDEVLEHSSNNGVKRLYAVDGLKKDVRDGEIEDRVQCLPGLNKSSLNPNEPYPDISPAPEI